MATGKKGELFRIGSLELVTDERYGKPPQERTIVELLDSGFVAVDKPSGPSSHQVCGSVANVLGIRKTGHLGTLDPNVSGVLPVLLGRVTVAVHYLMRHDKEYVGTARFGSPPTEADIAAAFKQFTGEITQIPPVGAAVARRPRKRRIYELAPLRISGKLVRFRVFCEAGTYIRTLIEDIGKAMRNPARLAELRRTRLAGLTEKDTTSLQEISEAARLWKENNDESRLRRIVRPIEDITAGMKKVWILDGAVDAICSGAQLAVPGIAKASDDVRKNDEVCIMTLKSELVAFGTALLTSEEMVRNKKGTAVRILRAMMPRGTYPKGWRTRPKTEQKSDAEVA